MSTSLLEIKNIVKTYQRSGKSPVNALNNISLTIKPGEVFGLLGANGAGKTTLSSIIATMHPATSGDVLFKGKSIYSDIWEYRHHIGLCPQYPNLDPHLNVIENLIFAGRYYGMSTVDARRRAEELLAAYSLSSYAEYEIDQLSGGTRQRVLIARSLVHSPDLVILDEPTVGLDPDVRRQLWEHIKILRKQGTSVILTTHYLDEAEYLSDRVCILNKGKVQLIETVEHLKKMHNDASLEDIFIHLNSVEEEGCDE